VWCKRRRCEVSITIRGSSSGNRRLKVMLDECITKKCAYAIIEFLKLHKPPVEAFFLLDFVKKQGVLDVDWSALLTPPSEWIVITGDSGASSPRIHAKGPPLQLILPDRGICGFYLCGKSLTQATGEERARIIISKIPDILNKSLRSNGGERYRMFRSGKGILIKPWPLEQVPTVSTASPLPASLSPPAASP